LTDCADSSRSTPQGMGHAVDWLLVLLRLIHIGGGVFWVGAAFTFFLFVAPSVEALPPPNRKAFLDQFVEHRRFPTIVLGVGTLTILAGAILYWRVSGNLNPIWLSSATGLGFTIGGLAGLSAWAIAAFVIRPTFARLGEVGGGILAAGRPPTAEEGARLAALGSRMRIASRALLALLAIAVLFMSISRYLR
jgi:uncharacterized membrane protein